MLIDQDRNKHIVQTFKPNSSSSSFTRPKTDMNVASGCPQFASLEVSWLTFTSFTVGSDLYDYIGSQ